ATSACTSRFSVASGGAAGRIKRTHNPRPRPPSRQGDPTMLQFESTRGVQFCDGLTRRDFLRVGALSAGAVGLTLADALRAGQAGKDGEVNCILLFLVGAPSHLDTWDLKPNAPDNIRGPFRPIKTNVSGIEIGEHFPLMAKMADRYALVRSVHHKAAPI